MFVRPGPSPTWGAMGSMTLSWLGDDRPDIYLPGLTIPGDGSEVELAEERYLTDSQLRRSINLLVASAAIGQENDFDTFPVYTDEELEAMLVQVASEGPGGALVLSPARFNDVVALKLRKTNNGGGDFVELQAVDGTDDDGDVIWLALYNHTLWMNATQNDGGARVFSFAESGSFLPYNWFSGLPVTGPFAGQRDLFGTVVGPSPDYLVVSFDDVNGVFYANTRGEGSGLSVEFVNTEAPNTELQLELVDGALTVTLATDGDGVVTTHLEDIQTAIGEDADIAALFSLAVSTGGLVSGLDETALAHGAAAGVNWGLKALGQEYLNATPLPLEDDVATSQRVQSYDDAEGAPKGWIFERDSAGTLFIRRAATLVEDGTAFAGVTKVLLDPDTATAADVVNALVTLGVAEIPA